jgi:hypothetical protein
MQMDVYKSFEHALLVEGKNSLRQPHQHLTNPYLDVLNQVLQVLDGQSIQVCIWFMHLNCIHFLLCADVLSQQINWLGYANGKILMYSKDFNKQFTEQNTKEQRGKWNENRRDIEKTYCISAYMLSCCSA